MSHTQLFRQDRRKECAVYSSLRVASSLDIGGSRMQRTHLYDRVFICAYSSLYIVSSLDIWAIWRLAYAAHSLVQSCLNVRIRKSLYCLEPRYMGNMEACVCSVHMHVYALRRAVKRALLTHSIGPDAHSNKLCRHNVFCLPYTTFSVFSCAFSCW